MNVGCFETGLFGVWASWHWPLGAYDSFITKTGNTIKTRKYFAKNMKYQEILEKSGKYLEISGNTTKYQEILWHIFMYFYFWKYYFNFPFSFLHFWKCKLFYLQFYFLMSYPSAPLGKYIPQIIFTEISTNRWKLIKT
jgi:hypothetical protein